MRPFVCGSKRQLQLLIPEARCFLGKSRRSNSRPQLSQLQRSSVCSRLIPFCSQDVDDLKDIADLEENVAESGSILMFMSRGCKS